MARRWAHCGPVLLWASLHTCVIVIGVHTGQGKLEKSGNLSGQGKVRGKYISGKVGENEKLVPSGVRFSG